jgi:hypothetical protein
VVGVILRWALWVKGVGFAVQAVIFVMNCNNSAVLKGKTGIPVGDACRSPVPPGISVTVETETVSGFVKIQTPCPAWKRQATPVVVRNC